MKKRKRPFSEKGDCCQSSTLKNFSKNKKRLITNVEKRSNFEL